MKEKSLRKFAVFPILLLLFIGLFTMLSPVSAVSAETTGLSTLSMDTNQNTHVICNNYDIFSSDKKLMMYSTSTGNLEKTVDLDFASGTVSQITTRIEYYNATTILVCYSYANAGTQHTYISGLFINTANLLKQWLVGNWIQDGNGGSPVTGMTALIAKVNNNYYFITSYKDSHPGHDSTFIYRMYPNPANVGNVAGKILQGTAIWIQSQTNINEIYAITKSTTGTMRYNIYKINVVTPSATLIGTSATDNVWGDFIYNFGSRLSTNGVSSWYDVGVCYNIGGVTQNMAFAIVRFNDTTVEVNFRSTVSPSSSVNIVRPFSVSYTGIWDRTTLLEGDYQFYYFGTNYGAMMQPITVSDLDTSNPQVHISYNPSVYGDNGVQWVNYYSSANNIGGLLSLTGVMLMIDYQNGKCVASAWASLNPSYSYVFSLSPQPLQLIGSGTILRAVCMLGQQYTYNGEIFADGVRVGNGTYTVSSTGLSTNYYIATQGTYGTVSTTGVITNGLLSFTLTPRTSAYVTIYEGIKVSININGATQEYYHTFVWTSDVNEDGLAPSTAPTIPPVQPTNNNGMGGTNSINLLSGGTFIGVIIVVLFTMLFGAFAGRDGILAGLMFSIMIASLLGLFPIYGILLSVVFGAILLLSHTSIGRGGGSSGE